MVMVNTVKNNVKQKGEPMLSLFLCATLCLSTALFKTRFHLFQRCHGQQ